MKQKEQEIKGVSVIPTKGQCEEQSLHGPLKCQKGGTIFPEGFTIFDTY